MEPRLSEFTLFSNDRRRSVTALAAAVIQPNVEMRSRLSSFMELNLSFFRIKASRFYNFPKTPKNKMATFPRHPKKIPPF